MSERQHGVVILPEYFRVAAGALRNQYSYRRQRPDKTLERTPIDKAELSALTYAAWNYDKVHQVHMKASTTWHVIEGLFRQSAFYQRAATMFCDDAEKDGIHQELAAQEASRLEKAAINLRVACCSSVEAPTLVEPLEAAVA